MAGSKVRYFDSSVVLSMLLNDSHAEKALHLWEESAYRVSSRLMLFENVTVIHRVALKLPANARQKWASQSAAWLEHISAQLYLHEIDAEVLDQCKAVSLPPRRACHAPGEAKGLSCRDFFVISSDNRGAYFEEGA
jgi:uncharacterized protein with PIN domain